MPNNGKPGMPLYILYTIVSVRMDDTYGAYLIKAEGPMGARMSWFNANKPTVKVGDKFSVAIDWKSNK